RLEEYRLRRDLDRVGRSPLVVAALKDERAPKAESLRGEIEQARERTTETFAALAALLPSDGREDKLRITHAVRASDDRWLPVELAAERLADSLAEIESAAERLGESAKPDEE